MTLAVLVVIIALAGIGAWLLLDDDVVQIALGALLLGHAAVLMLVGTRPAGEPPLLGEAGAIPDGVADPLPQALALTAIVISFGVTVLLLGLAARDTEPQDEDPQPDGTAGTDSVEQDAATNDAFDGHSSEEAVRS